MTSWLGPEAIVDAIVTKLQANMLSRVAAINLEKDDSIQVVAPGNDRYFKSARRLIPPPGPAILVMDGPMTLLSRNEGPHSLMTETMLAVWVMDEDGDEDRLARKLQRLTRAVIESLWDGDPQEMLTDVDGGQVAFNLKPHSTVPGDAFDPEHPAGPTLREFYCTIFTATRLEGA